MLHRFVCDKVDVVELMDGRKMIPLALRLKIFRALYSEQNCQEKARRLSTQIHTFTRKKQPDIQRIEYEGRRSIMTDTNPGLVCQLRAQVCHAPDTHIKKAVHRFSLLGWRQVSSHAGCSTSCLFKSVSETKPWIQISLARLMSNAHATNYTELAERVIEKTQSLDVMARSLRVAEVAALIESLQQRGFSEDVVEELLSKRLWLLQQKDSVLKIVDLLLAQGFNSSHVQDFLEFLPFSFQSSLASLPGTINTSILNLRSLGFSEADLWAVTRADPRVLLIDPNTVTSSLESLKQLFTMGEAKSILIQNPSILAEPFSATWSKFEYVHFVMGYAQDHMLRSRLFSHDLQHIQDRHMFLLRAGFFVHVKAKMDPNLNPNPPLKDVLDASDEKFAQMFGGISSQEYRVFRKMRQVEKDEEQKAAREFEDDYDEDDSDDDVGDDYSKKSKRKGRKRGKR